MKTSIKLIFTSFLLLLFVSCKTTQPNIIYITKDSIVTNTQTVFKDTIITIPGDTIRFEVPCNKDTVFIYKSKNSSSLVQIKDGKINVQNNCDEKDLLITQLRVEVDKFKNQNKNTTTIITKEIKYVPKIYKLLATGFWILLSLSGVLLLINTGLWGLIIGGIVKIVKLLSKKKK